MEERAPYSVKNLNLNRKHRNSYPAWMTVQQTAHMLEISESHVYVLVRCGAIPVINMGRLVRIDRDGLFLQAREQKRKEVD